MWQVARVGTAVVSFLVSIEIHIAFLGIVKDAVLRFMIDLNLRVVRSHVALPACFWLSREYN